MTTGFRCTVVTYPHFFDRVSCMTLFADGTDGFCQCTAKNQFVMGISYVLACHNAKIS
jgi:hypothetical protein